MFELVRAWRESGLKRAEFCKLHHISRYVLSYWNTKFLAASQGSGKPPIKEGEFIALKAPASSSLEIHYPNGVFLKVDHKLPAAELKRLIALY
jgi:hypothetical protein